MGFRESTGLAISPGLKTAIQDLEQEWKEIQKALRAEIIYLDGTPELQTTLVGDAKRAYTKVRTAISKDEDKAVSTHLLSLSERAEAKFSRALREIPLPEEIRSIVKLQHGQVRELCQRMKSVRDQLNREKGST